MFKKIHYTVKLYSVQCTFYVYFNYIVGFNSKGVRGRCTYWRQPYKIVAISFFHSLATLASQLSLSRKLQLERETKRERERATYIVHLESVLVVTYWQNIGATKHIIFPPREPINPLVFVKTDLSQQVYFQCIQLLKQIKCLFRRKILLISRSYQVPTIDTRYPTHHKVGFEDLNEWLILIYKKTHYSV